MIICNLDEKPCEYEDEQDPDCPFRTHVRSGLADDGTLELQDYMDSLSAD